MCETPPVAGKDAVIVRETITRETITRETIVTERIVQPSPATAESQPWPHEMYA